MYDDIIGLTEVIKNIAIIIATFAAVDRGSEAINQWLIERRGGDIYDLGKVIGQKMLDLVEIIHQTRTYSRVDEKTQEKRDAMEAVEGFDKNNYSPLYLLAIPKLLRAREILSEIKIENVKAKVLGVDFSAEIQNFSNRLFNLEVAADKVIAPVLPGRTPDAEATALITGERNDDYGKDLDKFADSILQKIQETMFGGRKK